MYTPVGPLVPSAPLGIGSGYQLQNASFTGDATNVVSGSPTYTLRVAAIQGTGATATPPTLGQTWFSNSTPAWILAAAPSATGQINIWNTTSAIWAPGTLPSIIGTLIAAQEPAHTGDMMNTVGSLTTTVQGLQGTGVTTTPPTVGQTLYANNGSPAVWVLAAGPSVTGQVEIWNQSAHIWAPGVLTPTVTISTSGPVSDPGGAAVFLVNNTSGGLTFTTAVGVAGYQRCYRNATGKTSVITVAVPASNAIDLNGVNGTTGTGTLVSGGALGDAVCLFSDASNHWYAQISEGTWINH